MRFSCFSSIQIFDRYQRDHLYPLLTNFKASFFHAAPLKDRFTCYYCFVQKRKTALSLNLQENVAIASQQVERNSSTNMLHKLKCLKIT